MSDYEKLDETQLFSTAFQSLYSFACFSYMLQMKNTTIFLKTFCGEAKNVTLCILSLMAIIAKMLSMQHFDDREILCLRCLPLTTYSNRINGKN